MRFKILVILFSLIFLTGNFAFAQTRIGHLWTEMSYLGGAAGTYSLGEDREGYFANAIGFYYSQLEHLHPKVTFRHLSDFGIIGTMSFFLVILKKICLGQSNCLKAFGWMKQC